MSGFGGFGTNPSGGGLFGAKPPDPSGKGFTLPTTTATTASTGLNFGTPTFGAGTNAGVFGTQQQNLSFGSGFGVASTTAAPAASSGFTFGTLAPNTSAPALNFGTTNTSAPTLNFGSNNTSAPTLNFGTATATGGNISLNLGTTKTTTPGLIPPITSTPSTAAASTPSFNFGLTAATTTTATTASLTFGVSSTVTSAGAVPTLSFGVSAASTSAVTTNQTTGFTFTQPTSTASSSFGVAKTTTGFTLGTTTTATPTFNLGTSTSTTTSGGTGLFGTPKTSESLSITTTTTFVGLGGIDKTQANQGLSGSGTTEPKHAKDHQLPDIIMQTLNDFQNFSKQQKSLSVEISHGSSKPLKKVQEDTEAMESLLTTITSGLTRNAIAVDKLKTETAQGLHQAETAQRSHESPPGLEYEHSAPADYFNDLVTKFETDAARLRVQIEASEKHLKSLTQSSTVSPQELTLAMRRLHETLIVLAARVQALHTTVQSQKEQFKNLRRVYFKDDTNIFDNESDNSKIKKQTIYSLRSLTGPTPFSETPGLGIPLQVDGLAMLAGSAGTSIPTSSNPSWMSPLQESPNVGFSCPRVLSNFPSLDVSGFQLSKPPLGNKRTRR